MSRLVAPYHIQRGDIVTPLAPDTARLSKAVDFHYMGSAEFEFGALPKSFRRIEQVADDWKLRRVEDIKQGDVALRVYGAFTDEEFEEYRQYLLALRTGSARTKESTYFDVEHPKRFKTLRCDFWWDIDNDVMFGFHKEFMNRLPHYVSSSIVYMNEQK